MTTPLDLEEMKKVDHLDLTEDDSIKVKTLSFKDFKTLFPFTDTETKLNDMVVLLMCVRQHIENAISQNYVQVVDGHKKHQWLNQKVFDVLRVNSIMLVKMKIEAQAQKAEESRQVGMSPALAHPYGDPAAQPTEESSERRFHVIPGSET